MRKLLIAAALALCVFVIAMLAIVVSGLRDDIARSDVALVLGNKVELDGTPSPRLRARLDRTLELFRAGFFPSIIVSGGTGKEGFDEAAVMRDYLIAHGVPASAMITDSHGETTFASAVNTARIAKEHGFKSVFTVTQYFHVPRARLALRRCNITEIHSAHARFFEWRDIFSVPRDTVGYGSYLFRHHE
jgi:vancomycin permeability regulator SanA